MSSKITKQKYNPTSSMEALLTSLEGKNLTLSRGEKVSGKVVLISDKDIVLDFGTKAEGIVSKKDFTQSQLSALKIGDLIEAFVVTAENESGQTILSLQRQLSSRNLGSRNQDKSRLWQRFFQAKQQNSKLTGTVVEVNRGGLVVEVEGVRGFLPSSQMNFKDLAGSGMMKKGLEDLVGLNLTITVIEIDPNNNRLIFSGRSQLDEEAKEKLAKLENNQEVEGKIVAVLPFGVLVDLDGVEGIIFAQEASWDKVEDLSSLFKVGDQVKALVIGKDETLGRLLLSLRQLQKDPFEELTKSFQPDDVISGTIKEINSGGLTVELKDGVEAFLPTAKFESGATYTPGQKLNFLVDSVDKAKRRINITPFITSTVGLIYK